LEVANCKCGGDTLPAAGQVYGRIAYALKKLVQYRIIADVIKHRPLQLSEPLIYVRREKFHTTLLLQK
jgi:hypothetical protein